MDQIKIGKFIADRRKNAGLTQLELAEKMGITDRAVSKWERGLAMPDSSIMLALCKVLDITVNDLLSGEVVDMERYDIELENKLLELVKQKEERDRRLLRTEIVMCACCAMPLVGAVVVALTVPMAEWIGTVMVSASLIPFLVAMVFALKIEQKAGYYECQKCGHRHVPLYRKVFFAMHVNRTRFLRCPKCGQRSWQKKVIDKE
ncbi:MAG: helix-turn-helix domain-containing protein [Clostridia bacterium]|nr:helix-turn-helix domain-containing protein [Clostridia bacterium]